MSTTRARVCPLLTGSGTEEPILRPHASNRCTLASTDAPLRRDIQARYCLGGRYPLCPTFAEQAAATRARAPKPTRMPSHRVLILGAALLLLILIPLAWQGWRRSQTPPATLAQPALAWSTPEQTPTPEPTLEPTPALTTESAPGLATDPSPEPTPVPSPAPSPTPSPTPSPQRQAIRELPALAAPVILRMYGQRITTTYPLATSPADLPRAPTLTPTPTATAPAPASSTKPEPTVTVEATTEISFIALNPLLMATPTSVATRSPADLPSAGARATPQAPTPLASPIKRWVATGPPERIVAPSIGLDAPVVPVKKKIVNIDGQPTVIWDVADYAAGWHEGSALPGQSGNIVLSGHHNIKGEVFRYVVDLEEGDEVILYANGRPYRYTVGLKMIVKEKGEPLEVRQRNARWIGPFPEERLTLVTCWPYTSNTHRVIVVAWPADVSTATPRPVPPADRPAP